MARLATVNETRFARAFLKEMRADYNNVYLVTAVIAWMRQESGSLARVIGNNPFNLRPGGDIAKFMSGKRKTKNGNGWFAVFASLEMGAKAAAARLVRAGHDWRGYWRVVAAARRGNDGSVKGMQAQALDFLAAIAMSAWSSDHYGAPNGEAWKNHLVRVWAGIAGIPAIPAEKEKVKKVKPRRGAPRDLPPGPTQADFINPRAIASFYAERHKPLQDVRTEV